MSTIQAFAEFAPDKKSNDLILVIECPACSTQRGFNINRQFQVIQARVGAGMHVESVCEKCKKSISVKILWADCKPGWTKRKVEIGNAFFIKDLMGLSPVE